MRIYLYEVGKTNPFDSYVLLDDKQAILIDMLYDVLKQDEYGCFNQVHFDSDGRLYWTTRLPTNNGKDIGLRVINKFLVKSFDLVIKENDVKTFYEALLEVIPW